LLDELVLTISRLRVRAQLVIEFEDSGKCWTQFIEQLKSSNAKNELSIEFGIVY